jgi:hypothetical protein
VFLGDLQVAMYVDHVAEPELASETVRPAEGLSGEPREVVDVIGFAVVAYETRLFTPGH